MKALPSRSASRFRGAAMCRPTNSDAIRLPVEPAAVAPTPTMPCRGGRRPAHGRWRRQRRRSSRSLPAPAVRHLQFFWVAMALVIAMLGVLILPQGRAPSAGASDTCRPGECRRATSSIASPAPEALPLVYIAVKADGAERIGTRRRGRSQPALCWFRHGRPSSAATARRQARLRRRRDPLRLRRLAGTDRQGRHARAAERVATGRVLLSRNPVVADRRISGARGRDRRHPELDRSRCRAPSTTISNRTAFRPA